MTTTREIMTPDASYLTSGDTLVTAARRMRELGVGALPVCGQDNRLQGMVTDRDIVINCVAEGTDPAEVTVDQFGTEELVTIGADDDLMEAIRTMQTHQVRRLPVIDGHQLVGIVTQADLARSCPPERVGQLVEAISAGA